MTCSTHGSVKRLHILILNGVSSPYLKTQALTKKVKMEIKSVQGRAFYPRPVSSAAAFCIICVIRTMKVQLHSTTHITPKDI